MFNHLLFTFLIFSFSFNYAEAFLENATHGYTNCMTCHYSPAGGNLLNDYGRSLSSELMSTWTVSKGIEQSFGGHLNGHVKVVIFERFKDI